MTMLGQRRPRVSARQAIVVVYEPASQHWAEPFVVPLFLDLLGTLVGVNGTSLVVTCSSREGRRQIAKFLPAGVELLIPLANSPAIGWTIEQMKTKGFERVVLVASDVIGLPPRVVATALSAIGAEGVVRADTPNRQPYLVGLSTSDSPHSKAVMELTSLTGTTPHSEIRPTRGIERFPRLGELPSVQLLNTLVDNDSRKFPHLHPFVRAAATAPTSIAKSDAGECH